MASEEGVSVQTVKLKVLYTFDPDQKDNHLARWPHSLEVNTCYVDSTNQIGVVELRTCLESVTAASPELLSRIDTDYAVYAFDYSEEETPLVGQGMLSKHTAAQDEPIAQDTEAMITGRITKGVMGLLSKNAQPTLEVKLRLKPVAAFPSQRTRSGSVSSQEGRIPQWLNTNDLPSQTMQRPMSPLQTTGLETMQRMLSEGGLPRERNSVTGIDGGSYSRPTSRPGTPSHQQSFNQSQRQPPHGRRDSFNSGYYSGEENADDGPARKRAKITKVDWPSKSNLNIERQPDSLRVAASTASSVRIHRPIAINPAVDPRNPSLSEEPIRPPTPRPHAKGGKHRARPQKPRQSTLNRQANLQELTSSLGGPTESDIPEGAVSSPEDVKPGSVSSTPANIPSSPPVMPEQHGPSVTSPVLPPMLGNHQDSGFMSGNLDDLFGDVGEHMLNFDDFIMDKGDDLPNGTIFGQDNSQRANKKYEPVFEEGNEMEGPPQEQPQIPTKEFALPAPPPRPISRAQSFTPALRAGMSSPKLAPAPIPRARQIMDEQKAKGLPAQLPQSEPNRILPRSNTWAPDMSDALMSEAPTMVGDDPRQKSKKKVGKEMTKARLENAIASGEMPPFCDNCGAIETPAWRRAWAKHFTCKWEELDTSLAVGEMCWKEPLEFSDDGTITKFKGLKCEKRAGDEESGWVQVNLCNPCGLWFHKQKCPRPKEKWQKKPKDRRRRRGGAKGIQPQQKPVLMPRSDAPTPMSDGSSPADTAPEGDENEEDNTGEEGRSDSNEPQLPPMPQNTRANSAEPTGRGLSHTQPKRPFPRQVHSSPGRGHGSEAEPVEIDLTPRSVRRQLFPSPEKQQTRSDPTSNSTIAHMVTKLPAFVRRSPRLNKTKDVFQVVGIAGAVAITADGKENILPDMTMDDTLELFFDVPADDVALPPSTPQRRSERILAKTPQRQFGTDLSPNMRQSPSFRTPKAKHPAHPALAALIGTAKKNLDEMTPFTRAIQDAWHGNGSYDMGFLSPQQRKTPKRTPSNKHVGFDFPDLPSLKGSSPMAGGHMFNMDFSELPTDQLQTDLPDFFSTDAVVPSSPPGFYNFINPDGGLGNNIGWATTVDAPTPAKASTYPEPDEMALNPPQQLRRSPRKNKK